MRLPARLRPLIASFLIHLMLFAALLVPALDLTTPQSKPPELVSVDIVETQHARAKNTEAPQEHSAPDKGGSPTLNLSDLGAKRRSGGTPMDNRAEDGFATAQKMDMNSESTLYPFIDAIWRKINGSTGYPADFVKERISGEVNIQFVVDRHGVFTGEIPQVDSDSDFLKTYVCAILVRALKAPLPASSAGMSDQMSIKMTLVAHFEFTIFGVGHSPLVADKTHVKNILYFKKSSYADPKLNELIEKFFTRYVPPIIPFPGGAYIDFVRAYEFVQKWGKPDPDDRRPTRILLQKEEWERLIRESAGGSVK